MKCWHCGTELIWGGDHDLEEGDAYSMVTNLSCPNCNAFVEVYLPNMEHEDHRVPEIPSPTPDATWLDEIKTQDGE